MVRKAGLQRIFAICCLLTNVSTHAQDLGFTLDQDMPVQHMVMAGSKQYPANQTQTNESTASTENRQRASELKALNNNEKTSITPDLASFSLKREAHSRPTEQLSQTSKALPGSRSQKNNKKDLRKSQRELNNWVVDTATALLSYSHTHLERDKKNNAELCDISTWDKIQDMLFLAPGAPLDAVVQEKADSKALIAGAPEFIRVEKQDTYNKIWIRVPLYLALIYPEQQKKSYLNMILAVGQNPSNGDFIMRDCLLEPMALANKPA